MAERPALSNRQRREALRKIAAAPRHAPVSAEASAARTAPKAGVAAVADLQAQLMATDSTFGLAVACAMIDHGGGKLSRNAVAELRAELGYQLGQEGGQAVVRMKSRDGLLSLFECGAIDQAMVRSGLAYRACYEGVAGGLASGLNAIGGVRSGGRKLVDLSELTAEELQRARPKLELHRSYMMARLNGMERAVSAAIVDGRELLALRLVVGEGRTIRSIATSGKVATAYKSAVKRALEAIGGHLEMGLRIGEH